MNYYEKYIKYKTKYLNLRNQSGGNGVKEKSSSKIPTYLIKTEFFKKDKDIIEKSLKERGWVEANKDVNYVDFLYMDGKFFSSARYLWALRTGVKNMLTDEKYEITDKTKLYQNMNNKYKNIADKYMMQSFNIDIKNYNLNNYKELFNNGQVWMIKPAMGWHGIGQKVVNNYTDFVKHINILPDILKENKYSRHITKKDWIVLEKYIDNPLLIEKKKFHIRFHALFYNRENKLRGFVFKKGHIFRAKKEFELSDFENKDIHDSHYIKGDDLIFPDDFIKWFGENNTNIVYSQLLDVIHYVLKLFTPNCYPETKYCYQVMGVDIMIKDNFDIVLLEIENKMGLRATTDRGLMDEYFRNIVEIVADDIYPPPPNVKLLKNYTEITNKN